MEVEQIALVEAFGSPSNTTEEENSFSFECDILTVYLLNEGMHSAHLELSDWWKEMGNGKCPFRK